jgi:hypothetical protein
MSSKRKTHSAEFKAKVEVDAIKGLKTASELVSQHQVHPTQISTWKKQALEIVPEAFKRGREKNLLSEEVLTAPLQDGPRGLPFHLPDYLELVNWTGQAVREDKRGAICEDLPPILERLGIHREAWLRLTTQFESSFYTWVGQAEHVHSACRRLGHRQARGISTCRLLFPS